MKDTQNINEQRLLVKVNNGCFPIRLYVFAIFDELWKH